MLIQKINWFIQGNRRKALIGTWLEFLLPKHIVEQYNWRLRQAKSICLDNGKCIACGCKMPAVLLADKGCKRNCYLTMMNKKDWKRFKFRVNTL